MSNTFSLLNKTILGSSQTNVEFTGLGVYAASFQDLVLLVSVRSDSGSDYSMNLQFNGSSSDLANIRIYGNGSVTTSYTGSDIIFYQNRQTSTSNTFGNIQIYISDFAKNKNKAIFADNVGENMGTGSDMSLMGGSWSQTAAITSIKLLANAGNFVTNSSFYLYGVKSS